jgi:DNA mismatch repair protein MutL
VARIRVLSNELANQIAAGEVVERPSSVVKELIENALDAGATRIQVAIENGGTTLVRVSDDGEGMDREDARLALERHATSKIVRIEDLSNIGTFGFRGEALPSIASVARVSIVTRQKEDAEGTEVYSEAGEIAVRPAGCAPGTIVEVRDLFYNVPARLKFLKSSPTESAHVSETVVLAALARPEITITLHRDGRLAREYLRAGSRRERALRNLGEARLEACIASRPNMQIEAYLAPPERARSGAIGLHLFVNGRPVRDRALARAVAHAYGSVLEPGRFPIGVVYIDIPPELVDVNVHPQKAEVRFSNARDLADAVTRELFATLSKAFNVPMMGPPSRPWQVPPSSRMPTLPDLGHAPADFLPVSEHISTIPPPQQELVPPPAFYGRLRLLGQAHATYLVAEGEDGLYVLDQHAADERINFDRLRKAFQSKAIVVQRLLIPEMIELLPAEVALFTEHEADFAALGVEIREAGPTAIAVHGVPKILARANPERIARDLLAELSKEGGRAFGGAADKVLATMACHGSVRAGDVLTREQAEALLRSLDGVDFSGHCPHGRPVVMRLGVEELERKVGR